MTPDHTIRTKNWPLVVPAPEARQAGRLEEGRARGGRGFRRALSRLFRPQQRNEPRRRRRSSIRCRASILVPGVGLFGVGATRQGRRHRRRHRREHGRGDHRRRSDRRISSCITEFDMFEVEYWSLEQAKLGKADGESRWRARSAVDHRRRLGHRRGHRERHGRRRARKSPSSTAIWTAAQGRGQGRSAATALAVACDVTDPHVGARGLRSRGRAFGGVDIVVSNAGAAWQGTIGTVDDETLRKSLRAEFLGPSDAWRRTPSAS